MSRFTDDIKPGDIINVEGPVPVECKDLVMDIKINIGIKIIVAAQKHVFCTVLDPAKVMWRDNHTMLFLGENTVFSCELPRATYRVLTDFDRDPTRIMSIYRFNAAFFKKALTSDDLKILTAGAKTILGWNVKYDVGQLADILVNTIAGYPYESRVHIFDADGANVDKNVDMEKSKQHIVCSVALAAIIAYWRHTLYETTGEDIPQPWTNLNPAAWTADFVKGYPGRWDCGSTFPAMFACSDTHFAGEFTHIGHYRFGGMVDPITGLPIG
jgi:hypothetical protein